MTTVRFPYANKQNISDIRFLATWKFWFKRFAPDLDPAIDSMPTLVRMERLNERLAKGVRFSLDIMCRFLVSSYRDTAQAVPEFIDANLHLLERCETINPLTGRTVDGVRLTKAGSSLLAEILIDAAMKEVADATDEGDIDDNDDRPLEVPSMAAVSQVTFAPELIGGLVDEIETEPFTATYRGSPVGIPVTGWRARLASYFWPTPVTGRDATTTKLALLLDNARELAEARRDWTDEQKEQAVVFAENVFIWGGVRQMTAFDWCDVKAVFDAAIGGTPIDGAKMNSGWTKVAAFASAHLPEDQQLVIWDSRVAHSLIRRLDARFVLAGEKSVPPAFRAVGYVPGRGGSRMTQPKYQLPDWRSGYRRWSSVYAGSALVRAIRDELNTRQTPTPDRVSAAPWTLREVEMVLFMDGY